MLGTVKEKMMRPVSATATTTENNANGQALRRHRHRVEGSKKERCEELQ